MIIRFFLKKFKKTVHENIEDHKKVECPICGQEIDPYWNHDTMALELPAKSAVQTGKNPDYQKL